MPILYSCHPRSKKRLETTGFKLDPRVRVNEPLGFNDYNKLQMNALAMEDLDRFCSDCDFVVHAAGVNRPKKTSEFMEGNYGFTSTLLETLKRHNNKAPIMITSSVQATLSGRFGDFEYGRSKLTGEELMFKYGEETGATVYVYRFENMVGKWVRPHYNSAVKLSATTHRLRL